MESAEDNAPWKRTLEEAVLSAQDAVNKVEASGERGKVIGRGASGDKTLLADRDAEEAIIQSLQKKGDVRILSEEAGEVGDRTSKWLAVIDPLDGSSNFERGVPFYCTSIAVVNGTELNDAVFGIVRNLVNGDVYYAEKGRGATKNGKGIRTSGTTEVSDTVAGVDLSRTDVAVVNRVAPLLTKVKRQVHLGANALELCLLSEGCTDSYVDVRDRMRVVDLAAAYLIAKEAGASITSPDGGELRPALNLRSRFSYVAASNQTLHRRLLAELNSPT